MWHKIISKIKKKLDKNSCIALSPKQYLARACLTQCPCVARDARACVGVDTIDAGGTVPTW